jgi:hypothetical protein
MKNRVTTLSLPLVLSLLAGFCFSTMAWAQGGNEQVRPRFVVLAPKPSSGPPPPVVLQTWNGSFTYNNVNYPYQMVGADPSTNTSVTIPTFIIPIKIVLSTGDTFDPEAFRALGPLGRTLASPIFNSSIDFVQGGVDLGKTQYIDAFQRGNFWSIVQSNMNTHVLLGGASVHGMVLPEQTLNVPAGLGQVGFPFGHRVAEVDFGYFDAQLTSIINSFSQIQPNSFPIALLADTYLGQGRGCCVGGYHSANGQQTYAEFTYVTYPGDFSQDVSALSHEVGEWVDDPLINGFNNTPCGPLEVGDPEEGHPNFGATPYTVNGFTYNLQDLVFLRYFGGPANGSVNSWWTFQNYPYMMICEEGPVLPITQ